MVIRLVAVSIIIVNIDFIVVKSIGRRRIAVVDGRDASIYSVSTRTVNNDDWVVCVRGEFGRRVGFGADRSRRSSRRSVAS